MIKNVSGFDGKIEWDSSKPDGMPRRLLDVSHLHALGWHHKIDLEKGVKTVYDYFVENFTEHPELKS